jgi:thermitase
LSLFIREAFLEEHMKKILLSTLSLVVIFTLMIPAMPARADNRYDPPVTELAEHVPGELLVRFSPGLGSAKSAEKMNEMGVTHKKDIPDLDVHLVKLPPGLSVEQAMERFSHMPGVEYAEPNYILHIAATSQVEIVDQWGLNKMRVPQAWETLGAGEKNEILIATVDSGIDKNRSDLSSRVWYFPGETASNGVDDDANGFIDDTWGWDFVNSDNDPMDDNMHGTAVSGVMAAAQDGAGVAGVCPWCRVLAVKVIGEDGTGTLDVVASGITYAANNKARVINLSLGAGSGAQTLEDAVDYAWDKGAVVVAAAGNDGTNSVIYPAAYANAIAVASTDAQDKHSCFSNYKDGYISVAAPGQGIYVIDINNVETGYGFYSGTSLSAPHVSGLAGLLLAKNPGLTNVQVRALIEDSSVDLGALGVDGIFGHGRVDALRAFTGDTSQVPPPDGLYSTSDTATGFPHARKLVRDSAGTLHVIWHTYDGSLYRIRYATSSDDGNSWDLQPDVFSSPYESYHSALAADDTYLYVVIPSRVNVGQPYQILFTRKPLAGGVWSTPVSLMGGTYNAVRPDIFVDPTNGRLHVIASSFDDTRYLYYRASNTHGETWETLRQFNPSNTTDNRTIYAGIYAHGDNIYVVTHTVQTIAIIINYLNMFTVRSTDGGLTWRDQTQIAAFQSYFTNVYGISLAGVGDRIYMGYEVGTSLYFRRNDGAGWSDYLTLEPGDAANVYKWPSITQSPDGQAWMLFEYKGDLYKRYYDGTTWQAKEKIGRGTYPNLKLGTGDDRVEWVNTACDGTPFGISYGSLNVFHNSAPQANDQSVNTNEDVPLNITLTGSDPDGDPLTYQVVAAPIHGALSGVAPTQTYTPNPNYNGSDSFTFKINDGELDSNEATVAITLNPVNDPPVAVDQAISTHEDTPTAITLAASDVEDDPLTYSVVSNPTHGTLSGTAPNLTYTPSANYIGPDSFTFKANDGSSDSNTALVSITVLTDLIFKDGFESGNLSTWSSSAGGSGDLSVNATAALFGSNGLQLRIDDNAPVYLVENSPNAEAHYRARFYLDPNSMPMVNGNAHTIFYGYRPNGVGLFQITLYYNNGYQVRVGAVDDAATTWKYNTYTLLSDGPHYLELEWQAATGAGANDGIMKFWVDGVLRGNLTTLDTDTCRVESVRLGAITGIDSTTRGSYFIDAFESRQLNYIGVAGVIADFTASPTSGSAPLTVTFTSLSEPASAIESYLWDFGDDGSSTETNPVHTFTTYGDFTVSLTVMGDGDQETATKVSYIHVEDHDLIFKDGFESGNLSAWSSSAGGSGDLSVSAGAKLVGSQGLELRIDDNAPVYLVDNAPVAEAHYRARFYFDPNAIAMVNGNAHTIFYGYRPNGVGLFQVTLYYNNGYQVRVGAVDDAGTTWKYNTYTLLSDGSHYLELEWQAATGAGANDGIMKFWVDGVQKGNLTTLDTDTCRVESVRLGAITGIDSTTRGSYFIDAFESRRQNTIGVAGVTADFTANLTDGPAPLTVTFTSLSGPVDKIESYLWDFGDYQYSTEANPIHAYMANGNYTVSLTVIGDGDAKTATKVSYIHVSDVIFADGFESGNVSAWSSSVGGSGDLSVSAGAKLVGSQGLELRIDDNAPVYLVENSPNAEAHYRARFYFDPNSMPMVNGNAHTIFYGYRPNGVGLFQVTLYYNNGYQVRVGVVDDAGTTWKYNTYTLLSDGPHYLELEWQAATGAGANDGIMKFWVDGVQKGNLTGLDTDTCRVESVRLGAITGIDSTTRGSYFIDAFESHRASYIGP